MDDIGIRRIINAESLREIGGFFIYGSSNMTTSKQMKNILSV